jgi:hypothetical protein
VSRVLRCRRFPVRYLNDFGDLRRSEVGALSIVTRTRGEGQPQDSSTPVAVRRPHLIPELLFVGALYMTYSWGRFLAAKRPAGAFAHANTVWNFERRIHLPSEAGLQHALLAWPRVMDLANLHYQVGYIVSLVGSLLWLYIRHPRHYIWYRRFLTLVTGIGLIGQILYPMAPPRLLPGDNVVDSAQIYGHAVFGPVGTGLANQYAAMPSLHVGWAVVVAVGAVVVLRSPWRWLFVLHPILTMLVVVVTGNHYWTDGIVATLIVLVCALAARRWLPEERPEFSP